MSVAIAEGALPTSSSEDSVVEVAVVDEDWLLIDALISAPRPVGSRIRFTSSAMNLSDGLSLIRQQRPHIVAASSDLFLSGVRLLFDEAPVRTKATRVAVFSDRLSDSRLAEAIHAGISGVLSKRCGVNALRDGLERIARGEFFVAEPLASRIVWPPGSRLPSVANSSKAGHLTPRQTEVLIYLASGDTIKEIAVQMHLSEKSVESHKFRLMKRLGITSRMQLCRWAIREGLISA